MDAEAKSPRMDSRRPAELIEFYYAQRQDLNKYNLNPPGL